MLQERVPFAEYFDVTVMQSYHKVTPMEQFMEQLAPTVWPPGRRTGVLCCDVIICHHQLIQVIAMVKMVDAQG